MNYIEIGLSHTEFVPTKKLFKIPKPLPMSGLSRRYLGLDGMKKNEIEGLCERLSKPKCNNSKKENGHQDSKPSSRFGGGKKMEGERMKNLIDRLYNSKSENKQKGNDAMTVNNSGKNSEPKNGNFRRPVHVDKQNSFVMVKCL